ncbi:hypothetical protein C8R44DRAFT_767513 [Mycena epipterygia]|nr:hypothetical protein C8R44DRAFT_767513 [Mycena epipterygia]
MAEILGTVASILQLIDTALKAREYIKDFHNAPAEQQKLFLEADHLKPLLTELQKRVSASASTSMLHQMTAPLGRFKTTMEEFTSKMRPADGRWSKFSKQLTWTLWNKKEAKEYLEEFESIKSLLNVWLAVDIWDVGQQYGQEQKKNHDEQQQNHDRILNTVERNALEQKERYDAAQHKMILDWITPLNFLQWQADIFNAWQLGTGEWLLADPLFKN